MNKFIALLDYIKQVGIIADEKLDCFVTDCQLQLSGKRTTDGGLIAAYKTYTASYEFENLKGDLGDHLITHITSWVFNNPQAEDDREVDAPTFDIEPVDNHHVDVMVQVEFEEKLHLFADPDGPYLFGEIHYSLQPPQIHVAETVEVDGEVVPDE